MLATILKAVGLIAPTLILIVLQPDLSTTLSIALVFCAMMYLAGLSYRFIGTLIAILVPVTIIFISIVVQPNQPFLHDYQQKRILAWLEPQKYASDEAYQQNNAIMAIGSGQLTGKGLNNNTTTSVKNGNFISEPQTDFIFAIVGEELGFVGCCIVIGLLLLIVVQCILIGLRAQDLAGRIICCGVAAQIGFQSFINIGVATGILPNTGIPLPFVSYGLTSLISLYMGIGIVLNIGLQPKKISVKGAEKMNIGLIAHDSKKTLMQNFCIAYRGILSKHELYATGTTGRLIEEVTNLSIHKYLAGPLGGKQQLGAQIAQNGIDALIFLRDPQNPKPHEPDVNDVIRLCDMHNIPMATNLATAEIIILALDRGDLDWREMYK